MGDAKEPRFESTNNGLADPMVCGGPDFLAALQVAWWEDRDVAPVCITGARNPIHPDALPYFTGKYVRIATHDDDAGRAAGAIRQQAYDSYKDSFSRRPATSLKRSQSALSAHG